MKTDESRAADPLSKNERLRSNFVRQFVQHFNVTVPASSSYSNATPKRIVQFWDNPAKLPSDVKECMDSWKILEQAGFEIQIYDDISAREFIKKHLGVRFEKAYDKCYHPSMKSDYFRYSYIFVEGGFYIDADDVYHGKSIDHLFTDGRLKLQPFCYDISKSQMVSPAYFTNLGQDSKSWIFYFNTTPLISSPKHPIVERALLNATLFLEKASEKEVLPEVQASTGPGNLTKSIFEILADLSCPEQEMLVLHDWEKTSTSKWPLSYRNDKRNWRLSNQQAFQSS